ncbi:MAG: MarR family transcriptional regulator [Alphaproteobacteria bacterium]|nr:MarR family transcriptional regulator [Alphaproteobacteria bacterium]
MTLKSMAHALAVFRDLDNLCPAQTVQCFLFIASAQNDDIHMRNLQDQMGMVSSSTSRNVAYLSKHHRSGKPGLDLVETYYDPNDGRYKRVKLNTKGGQLKARLIDLIG